MVQLTKAVARPLRQSYGVIVVETDEQRANVGREATTRGRSGRRDKAIQRLEPSAGQLVGEDEPNGVEPAHAGMEMGLQVLSRSNLVQGYFIQ